MKGRRCGKSEGEGKKVGIELPAKVMDLVCRDRKFLYPHAGMNVIIVRTREGGGGLQLQVQFE